MEGRENGRLRGKAPARDATGKASATPNGFTETPGALIETSIVPTPIVATPSIRTLSIRAPSTRTSIVRTAIMAAPLIRGKDEVCR
jgi:hypothetical protein